MCSFTWKKPKVSAFQVTTASWSVNFRWLNELSARVPTLLAVLNAAAEKARSSRKMPSCSIESTMAAAILLKKWNHQMGYCRQSLHQYWVNSLLCKPQGRCWHVALRRFWLLGGGGFNILKKISYCIRITVDWIRCGLGTRLERAPPTHTQRLCCHDIYRTTIIPYILYISFSTKFHFDFLCVRGRRPANTYSIVCFWMSSLLSCVLAWLVSSKWILLVMLALSSWRLSQLPCTISILGWTPKHVVQRRHIFWNCSADPMTS